MSAASILMSEDLFLCPICLDVFKDPVSTPCGHNFCKKCLTEHWKIRGRCLCPTCKAPYKTRPDLKVNTFISEMITLLIVSKPGDVPCDICMRTNRKALKSCLVCQVSYCETHLEPHVRVKGLKRHQLMDPVENLEERMCARHGKFLERFCLTDQTPVCRFCSVLDHRTHKSVPLKAYEEKKTEIGKIDAEIQQKQLTIQDFKDSVKLRKANGDREVARCLQVSTSLLEHIERGTADIIKMMGEKQRTENQVIQDLEQEMSKLMKRKMEVEQFSLSVDNHLQSKNTDRPLPIKDWSKITIPPGGDYSGSLVSADVDSQQKEKALH